MKTSVIIPAYKAVGFIGRAIRSVLRQKNAGDVEIIVIDDCSPDNLKEAVSGFPVIYLENPENIGPGPSRNRGIDAASGEFLLFLDADDELGLHQIATLRDALERHSADVAYCPSFRNKDINGIISAPQDFVEYILSGTSLAVPSMLFRKASCPRFDPEYICEDREWEVRMVLAGLKFAFAPETCYYYHLTGPKERYLHFSEDCARMRVKLRNWLLSPTGGQAPGNPVFQYMAANFRGCIHDNLDKGNHLIPKTRRNIIDAIGLLKAFETHRLNTMEENAHIMAAFHSWKLGGWRMPEMDAAFGMFPEFARMSAAETRAILNNFYVDRLPDKELMGQTLEREFGSEARKMGMRCYRKIQPQDVRTTAPINIDFTKFLNPSRKNIDLNVS